MEIHWKAPLQAKGFLKLIEMLIALLAFALVAGFSVTHTADCKITNITNSTLPWHFSTKVKYPFSTAVTTVSSVRIGNESISTGIKAHIDPINPAIDPLNPSIPNNDLNSNIKQAGQFFVVWGIFSIFYGIIALIVYMLTTANAQMEWLVNYLVLSDVIFHVAWTLCWFIASIEWAVAQNQLKNSINDVLKKYSDQCDSFTIDNGSYVQAAIADVFGFTSVILWAINIYWVILDTSFYLQWRAQRHSMLDDN